MLLKESSSKFSKFGVAHVASCFVVALASMAAVYKQGPKRPRLIVVIVLAALEAVADREGGFKSNLREPSMTVGLLPRLCADE